MFESDGHTAMLIVGLLYIALPFNTWIALSGYRSSPVALWCGGSLVGGIGVALIGLRQMLPDFLTIELANTLLVIGFFLRIQSLGIDLHMRWRIRWLVLATVLFTLVFSTLRVMEDDLMQLVWTRCVLFMLALALAVLAWKIGQRERNTNACLIGLFYGLLAAIFLFNLIFAAKGSSSNPTTLHGTD